MRLALLLFFLLCLHAQAHTAEYEEIHGNGTYTETQRIRANRKLRVFQRRIERGGLTRLAENTNRSLRGLFEIAATNLRLKGHEDTALEIEQEWSRLDGEIIRIAAMPNRDITHFEPWSNALAILYIAIEFKLGYSLCKILRLTDIATYVWTPHVVFRPCAYGREEFLKHFAANDPKYGSFLPVTLFWSTNITCTVATFGAGSFWGCSPIATLVELGTERWLASKLGNLIFDRACGP